MVSEKATVVVFLSFDCPNSNAYTPTLLDLHKTFESKGIKFVGICESDGSLRLDELFGELGKIVL